MSDSEAPPVGTLGFMANMLGLGDFLQAATDPNFHAYAQSVLGAIIATNQRCERIERQLDKVCRVLGVEADTDGNGVEYIPRRIAAAVPEQHGTVGSGSVAATGGAVDNGARAAPSHAGVSDGFFTLPPDLGDLLRQVGSVGDG